MKLLAGFLGFSAGSIVMPSEFDFPEGRVHTKLVFKLSKTFKVLLRKFFDENLNSISELLSKDKHSYSPQYNLIF